MSTAFDSLDDYERTLRRRWLRGKVVIAAGAVLVVAAALGLKLFKLARLVGHPSRPSPAAVVRVADDGTLRVDGCSRTVARCLADARHDEALVGGASYECLIVPSVAAPEAAQSEAMGECFRAGLSPSTMPAGSKW